MTPTDDSLLGHYGTSCFSELDQPAHFNPWSPSVADEPICSKVTLKMLTWHHRYNKLHHHLQQWRCKTNWRSWSSWTLLSLVPITAEAKWPSQFVLIQKITHRVHGLATELRSWIPLLYFNTKSILPTHYSYTSTVVISGKKGWHEKQNAAIRSDPESTGMLTGLTCALSFRLTYLLYFLFSAL